MFLQVIIGHDWGAYTAGRFALWYPHKVLALVMYVNLKSNCFSTFLKHCIGQDKRSVYPSFSRIYSS